jgi:Endodeoxyribonuclease RusA
VTSLFTTTEPAIAFIVWGTPGTAGNKTSFPVARGGGKFRMVVREGKKDHPRCGGPGSTRSCKASLALARHSWMGPSSRGWFFYLPKPSSAPKRRRTWPDRKPDLSKLLRAIEDPMNGVLIADDARIVEFCRLEKVYAGDDDVDQRPRAEVRLWRKEEYDG